jgi:Protein of unknown function (DUF3179)
MEGSPRKKLAYCWLLITSLLVSAACLAFPIYVIRPFRHQGARELAAALAVLQVRPIIEAICVLAALAVLPWYWQVQRRRSRRVLAAIGTFFVWGFAVLSRVNVYELMFHPMGHPVFVTSQQVKLDPDDKVIAVKLGGDARAYPIRSIAYHHIVNDVVGQVPIVATY